HGADGNVKRLFSLAIQAGGESKQSKKPLLDRDRFRGGEAVEPADLAFFPVYGELGFEPVNFVKGIVGSFNGVGNAKRQDYLKGRRHGPTREAQQGRLWRDLGFGVERSQLVHRAEDLTGST